MPTNNKLYPAQWNWDSAFIALGYSYFNIDYAIKELETLLAGQWNDGMVPHILFHDNDESYFPNYKTWECGNKIPSSGITQPPIIATIVKKIVDQNKLDQGQMKRMETIIKKLKKYLDWFYNYRDTNKIGLASIIHPWESGLDNSPIWDGPLDKVKIEENLKYERRDLNVSKSENRPLKNDYDAYITLLNQFKKDKYNPSKIVNESMFNVIDIGFNSIVIRATKDLIEVGKRFNLNFSDLENKITLSEESLIKFYKEEEQSFFPYDFKNHNLIKVDAISNYFILFADLENKRLIIKL
jgi:Trehalase.